MHIVKSLLYSYRTKTRTMKSEVFFTAWQLFRDNEITFSEALKSAWKVIKLEKDLTKSVTFFIFKKKNGEIRRALGTRNLKAVPECKHPKGGTSSDKVITFFDFEKQDWRSAQKLSIV